MGRLIARKKFNDEKKEFTEIEVVWIVSLGVPCVVLTFVSENSFLRQLKELKLKIVRRIK